VSGRGQYDRTQTKRERRAAQKRAILEAAIPVLASQGWAGASVEAVIQKAGVSRRTFYEHFGALDDVLFRIYDNAAEAAIEAVRMAMMEQTTPPGRIRSGVRMFLRLVTENPELARVVLREVRAAGPRYEKRREALEDRFAAMIVSIVEGADPIAALAVVGAITAVGLRFVEQRRERDLAAAASVIERLAVSALLSRE
jgi:AcrR family transcriptional regulator